MTDRKAVQRATVKEIIAIGAILEERVKRLDDETCKYVSPNDSDEVVAEEVGCGTASVANVRKQLYGNLIRASAPANVNVALLHELREKHNALVKYLASDGVLIAPSLFYVSDE